MPASRLLPTPFHGSEEAFHMIAQGAEGVVYRTNFLSSNSSTSPSNDISGNAALKIRYPKPWRHPILDRRLTRQRILAEARVLVKLSRELRAPGDGISGAVPNVLGMSSEEGWLATEWIEGATVKAGIRGWEERQRVLREKAQRGDDVASEAQLEVLRALLRRIGAVVGRLHVCGIVHGDLTTSNMMVRACKPSPMGKAEAVASTSDDDKLEGEIVLLDFGLAQQSIADEDRAVDLYVLERAFGSTHPKVMEGRYSGQSAGAMFDEVLQAYAVATGKAGKITLRKLEDVRMRGRKKSMLG
ncbi:bud32 protein kinase [Acrodontium crateriforme]|uniref:EKC/KEOPS complex subunit BUD32 n=1 Tax=Acrodontium crateriforme TaxID=150365 RepID=A0AAQ3M7J9_9PEZI|nr:bud32 protein kinase [Acrodontium crateriforme]